MAEHVEQEFQPGQRVMTVDGVPGTVQETHSTSLGQDDDDLYEVTLDHNLGGGTYDARQLTALRSTAEQVTAVGLHEAVEDYPEIGTLLHERPDPGMLTFTAGLRLYAVDEPSQGAPRDTVRPDACAYCGGTGFENLTDNGRVRQATCATCGGTMSAHPGAQWTAELVGDPSNHPKPTIDPASGANPGGGIPGVTDFLDFDSRIMASKTAAQDGPDWCRWRREARCTYPGDITQGGTVLGIPQDRGPCPWDTRWQQTVCPISEAGPMALMQHKGVRVLPDEVDFGEVRTATLEAKMAVDNDYRMQHQAPDADYGAPAHDLTGNGLFPDDVYTHPQYYDTHHPDFYDVHAKVSRLRGQSEKKIKIYRALPAEHAHHGFQTGDWVSISKEYARDHGKHGRDPRQDWPVISAMVPAKHIHTEGDLMEWGYNGPSKGGMVSFKGGHDQEVSQRADGSVQTVSRRSHTPEQQRAEQLKDASL